MFLGDITNKKMGLVQCSLVLLKPVLEKELSEIKNSWLEFISIQNQTEDKKIKKKLLLDKSNMTTNILYILFHLKTIQISTFLINSYFYRS